MSSIIGKQFENKSNGSVIKVVSIEGNIAILENSERISVERLLDRNHYGEYHAMSINESVGLNTGENLLHSKLFAQIQGLSNDDINRANDIGGTTIENGAYVNPVESHSEAMRKLKGDNVYDDSSVEARELVEKSKKDQLELERKMRNQASKIAQTIDGIEEEVSIPVNRNLEGAKVEGVDKRETSVRMIEDVGTYVPNNTQPINNQPIKQVNPMFTKMKRTKKVSLKIDIDEMMPSKDFLKMLEEGFEDSVLDYLTEEIAGKVLSDVSIKSQIKDKLHEYVYGKTKIAKKTATARKTTSTKKNTIN